MFLRQSTSQIVEIGPFLDITDGVTEEEGLTILNTDIRLSKDGAVWVNKNSGGATHREDGWYDLTLDGTDTDTVGELALKVQDPTTHLPVWVRWWVIEEAVYDAIYGAAAAGPLQGTTPGNTLDVNATGEAGLDLDNTSGTLDAAQIGADAITAAKVAAGTIDAATFAAGAIDATAIAADAIGASELATDAIGAAQLATDAVNEIRDAILPPINVAFNDIPIFMALTADHFSPATGLALGVTRSIDGGAFAAGTGAAAEIANGMYQYDASMADMNGLIIIFRFTGALADDTFVVVRTG